MTWTRIHEPIDLQAKQQQNQVTSDPVRIIWRGRSRSVVPILSTSSGSDLGYIELEDATRRYAIRFDTSRQGWILEGILTQWSEAPHERMGPKGFSPP